ncbi:zinc finger BED domain-containing protein RICESLEEPER 2-like [Pyrus ussuriensis x Pyrus communis]|uniref:Zinc finger BED domain-containing protein RICESLEEPER 2-like n=1 Tax=Pyrus ussuriensis x Pyrus communis TaxID=2448454 RepID=A0A5N5G4P5_9ROSA|nr:zinc finger BED domain-containing protein RICESLEEPER 2-like [Pyrus ussuriensis x Pyrus communis]
MDDVEINEAADSDSSGSNSIPTVEYFHYNTREGMAKYITSTGQLSTPAENVRFEMFIKGCIQPNDDRLGFVCVTAHFIDSSWMLQKRITGFRMLEYPHSDCVIFQCMMDIFREYSIDDKVSAITFDNVIRNDAIVDMFRNALHHPNGVPFSDMKCLGHNLTVPLKADAKSVETLLHNLYKVYESEFAKRETEGEDEESEFHSIDYTKRLMARFHAKVRKKEEQKYGPAELHRYLGMNHCGTMSNQQYVNLDVLEWWKSCEGWFPRLAVMARDLLAPSVVAMAPEFVFSSAGKQVLDQRRSMQSPKMLDCNFCLKDWEVAELRAQNWTDDMVEYFKDSNQSNVDESGMT